jgi:hypothetical protein
VTEDIETRIDELYALTLDRFIPERDSLATELRAAGDREAAERVKSQRKPVVAAWALNRLAREDPSGIEELAAAGGRLRDAQRRALSGGDTEPLRTATHERRTLVARLAAGARAILEREGTDPGPHVEDITNTLDAAVLEEEAASALAAGRLTKPLEPPSGFGDGVGLVALGGGKRAGASGRRTDGDAEPEAASVGGKDPRVQAGRAGERRELERTLRQARSSERRAQEAVEHARRVMEDLDRRRADAQERVRAAEAELRGAIVEIRRLESRLAKLGQDQ